MWAKIKDSLKFFTKLYKIKNGHDPLVFNNYNKTNCNEFFFLIYINFIIQSNTL